MASEMPVLPEVGSRMVWPGRIAPFSSASSISARATRSLTEPVGLCDSSLAQMRTPGLGDRRLSSTSGVLRIAGAGSAALWLGGCGSSNTAKPVAGDEWKQFGGTTLNFISENTAPTSAIAANLKPFTDLTGIEIKIVQLELAALVQKVAHDY